MFTDARARSRDERKELPTVAAFGGFRAEPVGIEDQRPVPQGGIPVQGIDSHGHDAARLNAVPTDRDVAHRQSRDPAAGGCNLSASRNTWTVYPSRGTSSGVSSRSPISAASAATRSCDFTMMPQRPQRIGKRRRGRVVAGEHEDQQVVADVVVGERLSGFRVGGRDQRVNQRCVQVRIRTARLQHLVRHLAHRGDRGAGAAAGRVGSHRGARTGRSARSAV